jgi:hypothetical protein
LPLDLEGNVKLGIKTLVALFIVVVGAVVTLMGTWGTLATKTDLEGMFEDHNESEDVHPATTQTLREVQISAKDVAARTERLEEKQDETRESIQYIRARVDFLTEQTVREVARPGRAARAVERLRAGEAPQEALSPE